MFFLLIAFDRGKSQSERFSLRFSRTCPRACIQAPALNYLHGEAHSLRIPSSKEIRFQPIKSAPSLISHINLLKSLTHSFIPSRRFLQRTCLQTPARITRLENHIAPPRARARARARAGLARPRLWKENKEFHRGSCQSNKLRPQERWES